MLDAATLVEVQSTLQAVPAAAGRTRLWYGGPGVAI